MAEDNQEIRRFSQLISRVVARLERIWEEGEGQLVVKITDDKGKRAKLEGGETERI